MISEEQQRYYYKSILPMFKRGFISVDCTRSRFASLEFAQWCVEKLQKKYKNKKCFLSSHTCPYGLAPRDYDWRILLLDPFNYKAHFFWYHNYLHMINENRSTEINLIWSSQCEHPYTKEKLTLTYDDEEVRELIVQNIYNYGYTHNQKVEIKRDKNNIINRVIIYEREEEEE